jgi:hypothetical protein
MILLPDYLNSIVLKAGSLFGFSATNLLKYGQSGRVRKLMFFQAIITEYKDLSVCEWLSSYYFNPCPEKAYKVLFLY